MSYFIDYIDRVMTCPTCLGRGHLIGATTTAAAACGTCWGRGQIAYTPAQKFTMPEEAERDAIIAGEHSDD